ncbi:MAG TPA: tripartite tricarboxylate transporter TctB family protein [Burkholderiales bacterium]|nr:tripartite tricarboxylate transporter TctB family protein [Burkholderiales bacterium]
MRRRSPDFWSGLLLAGLGAYIVVCASGWDYMTPEGPGPGFFPLWYGIAMLVLSLFLVVAPGAERVDWRLSGRAFAAWAAIAVSVAALRWLGFVASFGALTFFMVAVMYRKSLATAAVVAVSTAAAFYVLFPLALGVALP